MQLKACRIKIYDKAYYKDEKTSTTIPPHKNMYIVGVIYQQRLVIHCLEKHRIYVKLMLIDRKSISLGVAISPTVYLTRQLCIPDLVHKRYCPETYRSLAEP